MQDFGTITLDTWEKMLQRVFQIVSEHPGCAPILRDIGQIRFQLLIKDRREFSYWEEYMGNRVVPHIGIAPDFTVQAATTFSTLVGTLLRRISVMEAAA